MELFKKQLNINFMGLRKYTASFSVLLTILSIVIIAKFGLNFGLEFTGGTQVELQFAQPVDTEIIREALTENGFKDVRIQHYGSSKDVLLRIANNSSLDKSSLQDNLKQIDAKNSVNIRRIEFIGAEVGQELAERGGVAVLVAILATMIYIALRFEYRFAVSAAISLCHDSIIVLGVFALLQVEFDLASLASVLAVLGYSLNDTIVIFDRVRENFRKVRKEPTATILNLSINQTLSRTLMTSWLTLLVVIALLLFGGESLYGFSLALTVGIIFGTYSSIYVSGALALSMGLSRADLLPKPKAELDNLP